MDELVCMWVCTHLYIVQQHSGMCDFLCDYVIERNEWIPNRRPWSSSFLIQSRHQRINRFWIPHVNVYMFVSPSQFSRMHALNIDNNVIWQKYYIFLKSHVSPLPDYYQKQVAPLFFVKGVNHTTEFLSIYHYIIQTYHHLLLMWTKHRIWITYFSGQFSIKNSAGILLNRLWKKIH